MTPSPPPSTVVAPPPTAEATWEELIGAALVGTARRPPPRGLLERELGDPAAQMAGDPAAGLLAGAAVLSAYRRAGRLPGEAPARLPAPAEPDGRPACSEAALDVLGLILSGELPIPGGVALLAGQWVEGAARSGGRVPARLLPRLLELGSTSPALQAPLRVVAGPRGRWLAGHFDRWRWAGGEPADDVEAAERRFPTAAKAERPPILEAVRRADASRGLDLLRSTWAGDPAAERAALLGVLAVGLSDADEPFLEAALDDRSAAVRQVAAGLLGRLPASRRAARMAERLRSLIVVDGRGPFSAVAGKGRARTLSLSRPPEPDAAARRDGIDGSPPAGMGASAWRLVQLVAGTPLSFWTDHLGFSPAQVIGLAAGGEEGPDAAGGERNASSGTVGGRAGTVGGRAGTVGGRAAGRAGSGGATAGAARPDEPVLLGLEAAVVAQAGRVDPEWAAALFTRRPSPAVLAALPAGRAAEELTGLLRRGVAPGPKAAELFAACPGPWPADLGDAVLDRYRQLGARASLEVPAALPVLAARLDPAALPLVETWVVTLAGDQALRRRVQTLGHALSLRAVIHREFPT